MFSGAVILAAIIPRILSSPSLNVKISCFDGERNATQWPSRSCKPDDRTSHTSVDYRVRALIDYVTRVNQSEFRNSSDGF